MGRPFTPAEARRYGAVRRQIRHVMRATDRSGRITQAHLVDVLRSAGYARSSRYVRAVLSGEKRGRRALREFSATVRACRERAEADLPDWL